MVGKTNLYSSLFFIFFIPIVFLTKKNIAIGGNEAARLASVQSLVEQRTFVIDESLFVWTVDKVLLDGHYYAGKPPMFTMICAGIYAFLKEVLGFSFNNNYTLCIYLISLFGTGMLTCVLGPIFYKCIKEFFCISLTNSFLLTLLLFGGTLIGVYSVTLNNHTPGSVFIFSGFYFFFRGKVKDGCFVKKEIILSSILLAIGTSLEIPAGIVFGVLMIFVLINHKEYKLLSYFLIPLVIFALINIGINLIASGRLFHPPVYSYGWNYEGSYMKMSIHGLSQPQNIPLYAFHVLFGHRGLFIFSPILILGVLGIWKILKGPENSLKLPAKTVLMGLVIFYIIHIFITGDFGGPAYGFRFWIPMIPLLFLFSGKLFVNGLNSQTKKLFISLAGISVILTLIGSLSPWVPVHEGYREEFKANQNILSLSRLVKFSPPAILTALVDKYIPDSSLVKNMKRIFIHQNESKANCWLGYYYLGLREKERAARYFYDVLKVNPNNLDSQVYFRAIMEGKY